MYVCAYATACVIVRDFFVCCLCLCAPSLFIHVSCAMLLACVLHHLLRISLIVLLLHCISLHYFSLELLCFSSSLLSIFLLLFIMIVYSTIPAVYREDSTALRYTGDDTYTGTQYTSGPGSVNHTGTGSSSSSSGNGNGIISCPDFELPAMVTSEDFWESALIRERRERESLISALYARELVVGGDSSSSSSGNYVDGRNSSNETVVRSSMRNDEIGVDREGNIMNSNTLSDAPATAPSSSSSSTSGSSRSSEDQEVRNTLIPSSIHPSLPQHVYVHTQIYTCINIFCQSSTPCLIILLFAHFLYFFFFLLSFPFPFLVDDNRTIKDSIT